MGFFCKNRGEKVHWVSKVYLFSMLPAPYYMQWYVTQKLDVHLLSIQYEDCYWTMGDHEYYQGTPDNVGKVGLSRKTRI